MSGFQIKSNSDGILLVSGALNYAAIKPAVWEHSRTLLAAASSPIQIDLRDITHSDSTGVALLISWVRYARKQQKEIQLTHLPEQMRAIIRVSGLEKLLPLVG